MLTRLGEAGADAFTIMRIAGQSSVTVSQQYAHPSPESLEMAFERLDVLNRSRCGESLRTFHHSGKSAWVKGIET